MAQVTQGPASGMGATIGYGNPASRVDNALEGLPEDQLFTITLNEEEVKAKKGETIMEVCHREDIYVPHYCWHPALSIAGNCRLCLVEVEKVPKPIIACQTQVTPGMVVRTSSEVAKAAQEWMMEFLLVNHPLDCPICDRGGECQLQRYSMEYGTSHTRMADKKRKFIKPQADPLIDIERNRCIMCTRCIRFCDEIGGEHVMGVFARGNDNYIGTFGQGPVSNIFSGNVIDLCPVGCLTSKPFRFKARVWELKQTQTTCTLCSSGCKVTSWTRNNKLFRTTPPSRQRHDHYTINEDTEEFICNQGRFGNDFSLNEKRQVESMVRVGGHLTTARFEEAARKAAASLKKVADEHGPESVAILVSPSATNEEGLLARKLAHEVIGTNSIDWRVNYATPQAANAVSTALHIADGDLENVPDVIVVINGDLVHQSPVLAQRLQEMGRRFGRRIVMLGHHHDAYLANHSDLCFHNGVGQTWAVLDELKEVIEGTRDAANLARLLNCREEDAAELAKTLKLAESGIVVQSLEDFAGLYAPQEVFAAAELRGALGEGWGYLPVVRERNAVGLNGLGVEPREDGVTAGGLVEAIRTNRIKGLLVLGADTLSGLKEQAVLSDALESLDAFVIADLYQSDYNRHADVFLALAGNLENDGTLFDIEGNIALLKSGIEQQGDARPGYQILTALGRAAGEESFGADSAEEAWELVRTELSDDSGACRDELELEGSSNAAHYALVHAIGGARNRAKAYNPGNYREDGLHLRKNDFVETVQKDIPQDHDVPGSDSLLLAWGTHVSGQSWYADKASIADILLPKPFLEVHPADAATRGLKDQHFAVLTAGDTRAKVGIKISKAPAQGTVYMSAGVAGGLDCSENEGPVSVKIQPLDEMIPNQGSALMEADPQQETH